MTQDEIIEMAREAHRKLVTEIYVGHMGQLDPWTIELLKIFAKLVAAKEQEDIIQIIKETPFSNWFQADVIEAIRARGEQA